MTIIKIYLQNDEKRSLVTPATVKCTPTAALLSQWSHELHFVFSGLDFPQNNWQAAALTLLLSLIAVQERLQTKIMLP